MKRLGFIELFYHHEIILHFVELFEGTNFELSFFIKQETYDLIPDLRKKKDNYHWFIKKDSDSVDLFIDTYQDFLNTQDVLLITTLSGNFAYFGRLQLASPVILLIHNASAFINRGKAVTFLKWKDNFVLHFLRILKKVLIDLELLHRKKALKSVDFLSFTSSHLPMQLAEELKKNSLVSCPTIPLVFYRSEQTNIRPILKEESISIAIPGTVSSVVRDYDIVKSALERTLKNKDLPHVTLLLLGKAKGKKANLILRRFQELPSSNFKLISFNYSIPQAEYELLLKEVDFLILPLKRFPLYSIYQEEFGTTKISGVVNDMVKYGIPSLIPKFYTLDPVIEEITERFEDDIDLGKKLTRWAKDKTYLKLREKKRDLISRFSKEEILKKTLEIFCHAKHKN